MVKQKMLSDRLKLYRTLFTTFFKIGLFTFGGGYAMIPLMEREVVEHQKWFSEVEVVDIIAVAQSLPGPIAVNTATFIGRRLAGYRGALVSLLGCTLPSILVIIVIAATLVNIQDNIIIQNIFRGVRAAVTALILISAVRLARKSIHDAFTMILAAATVIVVSFLQLSALWAILFGCIAGLLYCQLWQPLRGKRPLTDDHAKSLQEKEKEIDDDASTR